MAFAGDVDAKIEAALTPINAQLSTQDSYLKRLVKKDIREELYALFIELCNAETAAEGEKVRNEIADLQSEYEILIGRKYAQPNCDEL